ncbi:hypothetical protein KIPB_007361, partial [Kipferlia bialata]|eukprot:g7361.t1
MDTLFLSGYGYYVPGVLLIYKRNASTSVFEAFQTLEAPSDTWVHWPKMLTATPDGSILFSCKGQETNAEVSGIVGIHTLDPGTGMYSYTESLADGFYTFGETMSAAADTVVIGDYLNGDVHVYKREAGTWEVDQVLDVSNKRVALYDDTTMAVGYSSGGSTPDAQGGFDVYKRQEGDGWVSVVRADGVRTDDTLNVGSGGIAFNSDGETSKPGVATIPDATDGIVYYDKSRGSLCVSVEDDSGDLTVTAIRYTTSSIKEMAAPYDSDLGQYCAPYSSQFNYAVGTYRFEIGTCDNTFPVASEIVVTRCEAKRVVPFTIEWGPIVDVDDFTLYKDDDDVMVVTVRDAFDQEIKDYGLTLSVRWDSADATPFDTPYLSSEQAYTLDVYPSDMSLGTHTLIVGDPEDGMTAQYIIYGDPDPTGTTVTYDPEYCQRGNTCYVWITLNDVNGNTCINLTDSDAPSIATQAGCDSSGISKDTYADREDRPAMYYTSTVFRCSETTTLDVYLDGETSVFGTFPLYVTNPDTAKVTIEDKDDVLLSLGQTTPISVMLSDEKDYPISIQ